jgi:hypothetical protein
MAHQALEAAFLFGDKYMARTATAERKVAAPESTLAIHHMTRALASTEGPGQFTVDQLDAHCQTWLDQGYRLLSIHPTYIKPEQGPGGATVTEAQWHILYIFVRD